ncbi:hypothetical protein LTS07_002914 [Exophiala sideris]|uniref:Uncharacterized protein n=1 Tax=Exophiala sideris TaxID=1016849 RepID=A0ABR0JK94_9EURO|nr:hypothetical protein LTS07_002914 [Exophiala sideris]KAK5066401.1 hypothetical protein LTR69_002920 [Exophiala sideris]KAK5187078.1 hypothetical protein LTR44_001085 [Eurotiomycetes sp. CCFEE 6388]
MQSSLIQYPRNPTIAFLREVNKGYPTLRELATLFETLVTIPLLNGTVPVKLQHRLIDLKEGHVPIYDRIYNAITWENEQEVDDGEAADNDTKDVKMTDN